MHPSLLRLTEKRTRQHELIDELCGKVETEDRNFSDAELTLLDQMKGELSSLDRQIGPLQEVEELRAAHETSAAALARIPAARPASREARASGGNGFDPVAAWPRAGDFLVDYLRATPNKLNDFQVDARAAERIHAHQEYISARAVAHQTTGDTPGLLPIHIVGQVLNDLDASRPFVSSIGVKPLGGIAGKVFNRPHVTATGHTTSGTQLTEKTELPSKKLVIEAIPFTKESHGASLNISRQDLDWSDPSAWQAILDDMSYAYAADTDDVAALALDAAVPAAHTVTVAANDIDSWVTALYAAASMAATANSTQRASTARLPNVIWTSVDMWGKLGGVLDAQRGVVNIAQSGLGSGTPSAYNGTVLSMPRVMVPGLPAGTMIMGNSRFTEFYEERIGMLQAVEPALLGLTIATGGYVAYGTLDPTVFVTIVGPP